LQKPGQLMQEIVLAPKPRSVDRANSGSWREAQRRFATIRTPSGLTFRQVWAQGLGVQGALLKALLPLMVPNADTHSAARGGLDALACEQSTVRQMSRGQMPSNLVRVAAEMPRMVAVMVVALTATRALGSELGS
jgi:triphosphoribosyl-dephospho-CoA synthetase